MKRSIWFSEESGNTRSHISDVYKRQGCDFLNYNFKKYNIYNQYKILIDMRQSKTYLEYTFQTIRLKVQEYECSHQCKNLPNILNFTSKIQLLKYILSLRSPILIFYFEHFLLNS